MATWEEIGQKWSRAQQMGWQAIQAAMDVGEELQQKKIETPHGEFVAKVTRALPSASPQAAKKKSAELMRLALHRDLIEEHKPDSSRFAISKSASHGGKRGLGRGDARCRGSVIGQQRTFCYASLASASRLEADAVSLDNTQRRTHGHITIFKKSVRAC